MISMGRPFRPTLPTPSGGFGAPAERVQLVFRYSGLVSAADIPPETPKAPGPGGYIWQRRRRRRHR